MRELFFFRRRRHFGLRSVSFHWRRWWRKWENKNRGMIPIISLNFNGKYTLFNTSTRNLHIQIKSSFEYTHTHTHTHCTLYKLNNSYLTTFLLLNCFRHISINWKNFTFPYNQLLNLNLWFSESGSDWRWWRWWWWRRSRWRWRR